MSLERDLKSLYPFLHGKCQDAAKLGEALLHSVDEKARESRETNARFFEEQGGALVEAANAIAAVYRRGGRMFSMGNGGSSCDASHFAVEFVHPITTGRPALAAVNLVADLATITAIGNDVGFEHIFTRQLIAQAKSGDGLIGFSTSGNSSNLLDAFAKAKEMGVTTIGFAGGDGEAWLRADSWTAASSCPRPRSIASRSVTSPLIISLGISCIRCSPTIAASRRGKAMRHEICR